MVYSADNTLITVGLKCETDFLAKSEIFTDCLVNICELFNEGNKPDGVTFILDQLAKDSKEQIELSCDNRFLFTPADPTNYYLHHDERKLTIVQFKKNKDKDDLKIDSEEDFEAMKKLAKYIAMHIVAFSPDYLCMDNVDWSLVDLEIPSSMLNKPPSILEKIAKGKKAKYGKDHVLYNQPYAKDLKKTIWQVISEFNKEHACDIEISDYYRMEV